MKFLLGIILLLIGNDAYSENVSLIPHKENYILPLSLVKNARDTNQNHELKFQISFKIPIWKNTGSDGLYAAYTQKSFWQAYDKENSRPFRETNYNPELFYSFYLGHNFIWDWGYEHESNGKSDPESRSWDRLFTRFDFHTESFKLDFKIWKMFSEDQNRKSIEQKKESILNYYGLAEMRMSFFMEQFQFSTLARYSFSHQKGFLEVGSSYPVTRCISLFAQYSKGYGDSLLDYNRKVERSSLGFLILR